MGPSPIRRKMRPWECRGRFRLYYHAVNGCLHGQNVKDLWSICPCHRTEVGEWTTSMIVSAEFQQRGKALSISRDEPGSRRAVGRRLAGQRRSSR